MKAYIMLIIESSKNWFFHVHVPVYKAVHLIKWEVSLQQKELLVNTVIGTLKTKTESARSRNVLCIMFDFSSSNFDSGPNIFTL